MKKVLILEDEVSIRSFVVINLNRAGYEVIEAGTGMEALEKLKEHPDVGVAILDIMLPDIDGFEVCRNIRATDKKIGIIMLTARSQEMDKVNCLMIGADDYVTKPFSPSELVARVESVLRRTGRGGALLRAWDVTVDTVARSATKAGVPVALTPREFDLLEQLLRNRGAALYRDVLFERVWGGEMDDGTRTLDLHIQRLRKKLGWQEHIKTVYKVGYLLEMEGEP